MNYPEEFTKTTPNHIVKWVLKERQHTCNTIPKEHLKPKIGMIFDTLKDVEEFYKSYAHEVGFLSSCWSAQEGK